MIRLQIFKDVKVRLPKRKIQGLFEQVIKEESDNDSNGSINLIFTTDGRIKKLNKAYRSKDKSTDVLSFNIEQPTNTDSVFGEIYISVPTAMRQAKEYGFSLDQELLRLSCHGLLHLLGYDHIKNNDRTKMETRERVLLKGILH